MKRLLTICFTIFLLLGQQTKANSQQLTIKSPKPIKVACIGNSVTYGYGHENPDSTSYPSQLAVMLGDGYEVGNFGKSGATLLRKGHRPYNEQEEFKKALEFAPDIAIIHLGLNDTDPRNWKYYKREFISDYVALIEAFEKVNPDVEIYICRMTPIFHWHHRFKKGTRDWYWEIQETIENIAYNIAEVKLIDLQEILYHRPDLMPDALHPNPEGAKLIAQRVYSAITGDFGGLSLLEIYSDNMVLQRDKPFVVKGLSNAGDEISVSLDKQKIITEAGDNGKWEVTFDALKVDGKKHTLTIDTDSDYDSRIEFKNIVVGEVILCSGNKMSKDEIQKTKDFDHSPNNDIRLHYMDSDISSSWVKIKDIRPYDSIGEKLYNVGVKISDSLQMPVGLIYKVVEDAPIESFIDRKTLEWHPILIDVLYEWRNADNVKEHLDSNEPSYNYDKYIAPLSSFPINSVIWVEDDSDIDSDLDSIKKSALIESWKKVLGEFSLIKM